MDSAAVADGKNCPDIRFDGTLRIGAIAADVLLSDRDWALSKAD